MTAPLPPEAKKLRNYPIDRKRRPLSERFWEKVCKGDDCWEWTAAMDRKGYGKFGIDGRTLGAHRVAYELEVGPLLPGMVIDHLCENPACVRPDHLQQTTQHVNVTRGVKANAQKDSCPQGHPYAGNNLVLDGGSRKCRTCLNARDRQRYAKRASAQRR